MKRAVVFLTIIFLAFLLMSSSDAAQANTGIDAGLNPTSLHVIRGKAFAIPGFSPLDRTITNVVAVRQLYNAALELPRIPPDAVYSCPVDLGLIYHFYFQQGTYLLQKMDLDITGCRFLSIGGASGRFTNEVFFALAAHVIGIPSLWTKTV